MTLADDHLGLWKLGSLGASSHSGGREPTPSEAAEYTPLEAFGPASQHVVGFMRRDVAVVVPRLVHGLSAGWLDTTVDLGPGRWTNVLAGDSVGPGRARLAEVTAACPVAVLTRDGS